MIKNKAFKISTIVAISLSIGVVFYLSSLPKQLVTENDPILISVKESLIELNQDKQITTEEKIEKTNEILDKLPPEYHKLKHQYQIAMSKLPDVTFYGRVIDQYGQPVSSASVWYEGTNAYLSAGSGRGRVKTDEAGYFTIETVGAALVLGKVTHPDIEYAYQQDALNNDNSYQDRLKLSKRFLSYIDKSASYDNWRDHNEKDKAYIIQAWRLRRYEGAKNGSLNVYFKSDGSQFTIDFFGNNYKNQVKDGLSEGHLIISCTRKTMSSLRDYGDWSITVMPVDGGIQVANGTYMNEAPVDGYKSSLNIDMKLGSADYHSSLLNQRYYFTANGGNTYGSLFIHFMPHSHYKNNECRINVDNYKINTTGSRSLELKKRIK